MIASLFKRAESGGAKQRYEDEVVEMPGLEGRVLSVVGEAEQLALIRLTSCSGSWNQRKTEDTRTVVAEDRPSADRLARRLPSRPRASWV